MVWPHVVWPQTVDLLYPGPFLWVCLFLMLPVFGGFGKRKTSRGSLRPGAAPVHGLWGAGEPGGEESQQPGGERGDWVAWWLPKAIRSGPLADFLLFLFMFF